MLHLQCVYVSLRADTMSGLEACCAAGSAVYSGDGTPSSGRVEQCGDLSLYVVGSGKTAVIVGYDIFGFESPNTRSNCEVLARGNPQYLVVMPDFFKGATAKRLTELNPTTIGAFVAQHGSYDATRTALVDTVLPHLRAVGVRSFFFIGFCWGGRRGQPCQ